MENLKAFQPKKIIVRMPNWVGDLVMATPILSDLRSAYPDAEITAMARYPLCELLQEDPELSELFCFCKGNSFGRRESRRSVIEKLRKGKYDLGILMPHSFSAAWLFWQGSVKYRLGYEGSGRGLLLTHRIGLPENIANQHLVTTYKTLLSPLGIPLSGTPPRLYVSEKELQQARELLRQHGVSKESRLVGINPGATYGSAKCWLPERFREVTMNLLQDPRLFIIFFGDQGTASLVKEICQDLPSRVINMAGLTSLRELSSLIKLCNVLLTNDSGPMHIADALGTPVVALFGSTSEVVTGPYRAGTVIHKHVDCSPCYQRRCPIDFRCMKKIESDEVTQAILRVLHEDS